MTEQFLLLKDRLQNLYDRNPFVKLLQMQVAELEEGMAKLTMPVDPARHTNLYNTAHGGALASMADTAMGIACTTTGKKVVTVDMNMNYIRSANAGETVSAVGRIIHNGKQTMVAEADIVDANNNLILKARATFFVIGNII
jgi:acyl-CoA thioesterase